MAASVLNKISVAISNSDLFSAPVQLRYKGETSFNTFFGGFVSLMLIVGLSVYFVFEFDRLYHNPNFLNEPNTYNFQDK